MATYSDVIYKADLMRLLLFQTVKLRLFLLIQRYRVDIFTIWQPIGDAGIAKHSTVLHQSKSLNATDSKTTKLLNPSERVN